MAAVFGLKPSVKAVSFRLGSKKPLPILYTASIYGFYIRLYTAFEPRVVIVAQLLCSVAVRLTADSVLIFY